uniref:Olfactory receptor n=1 Tax=Pyxicephalus adspersus TaxID=30357 RepID=A0AAV3AC55_PYXAD|nr:TPA: hypothetical protein GDO54_013597 [Pyxicephalus adspersus]
MYFFLVCLSFMEIIGISSVNCKLLSIIITADHTISKSGCIAQSFFYYFFSSADFLILSVMSIDRFMAICYPLRYSSIMKPSLCINLVLSCFSISLLCLLYPTYMMSRVPFCGQVLDHFFCDSAAMLSLVCVDITLIKLSTVINSVFILIIPLIITSISYIFIVFTVIKMRSTKSHHKTFSTCVSHLTMVFIVFGSAIFIEIRPSKSDSVETDKAVNFVSTILGPLLNPFIYTLRNQKVKDCLRDKKIWKYCQYI